MALRSIPRRSIPKKNIPRSDPSRSLSLLPHPAAGFLYFKLRLLKKSDKFPDRGSMVKWYYVPMHREGWLMNFLYIAKCKNGKYYIGSTNNLERRIVEHNTGKTKSLRYLRPIEIVFRKIYPSLIDARRAEIKLKRLKSRQILEKIIQGDETILGL